MRRVLILVLTAVLVFGLFGCASMTRKDLGILIGGAGGAALGAAIGDKAGNTAVGAILGAVVGGAAGGIIGNYMDEQVAEMEADLEGTKIERVGEGIKITFDSGILFDVDRAELRAEAEENIAKLAAILNKYDDTNIMLEGHTDSDGAEDYNMALSERRARAVENYLAQREVGSPRMSTTWYGESQPVADNGTPEGKQANRRVEIAIMANDELKKAAEQQAAQHG
ncbi:MAG: OmpA family protein [Candidatus Eisenbacteria sp.]|nr:OmpA family protein [Candidatus Eisenbacteria bacterium]